MVFKYCRPSGNSPGRPPLDDYSPFTIRHSRPLPVRPDGQGLVDAAVRARDDVDADELADAAGGGGAGVRGGLDRGDVAADDGRDEARADLLVADQRDVGGLHHRVRRLDHRHQPLRLNHAECFLGHSVLLLSLSWIVNRRPLNSRAEPRRLTEKLDQLLARQADPAVRGGAVPRAAPRRGRVALARRADDARLVQVAAGLAARALVQVAGALAHLDELLDGVGREVARAAECAREYRDLR